MLKKILSCLVSASMIISAFPVLAENPGESIHNDDLFETNAESVMVETDYNRYKELTKDNETVNLLNADGIVREENINDLEYDIYDPDKDYQVGDAALVVCGVEEDEEGEDALVTLYTTAYLRGNCSRDWKNISGSVTNLYPTKWCETRTSYLSLGQTFSTKEIWQYDSGEYVYLSTTNFYNGSTNYGQLWVKKDSSCTWTINHTIGGYNSSHPHYGYCDFDGSTMTGYTTKKTTCTSCYPPYFYYSANGGSGAPSSQSGYPITISSTIPTRFPYKFTGWNFSGSSTKWYAGETYYGSANTSYYLYANWEDAKTMTSSNNSSNSTYIYPKGVTGYFSFVAPETATYAFESTGSSDTYGYIYNSSGSRLAYNDNGGDNQNFKVAYAMTAGTTYYLGAKYYSSSSTGTISTKIRRQYDVSYDANGGSGAPAKQIKLYGDTVTLSDTEPANGNLEFLGWATSADATEAEYSAGDTYTADADVTLYAVWETVSGQCGDNLTWTLDGSGTLTISGTGDMWDYTISSVPTWNNYKTNIKNVIISDGVTSVGDYAFCNCRNLENVEFSDTVKSIGIIAFFDCISLSDISIPESVTSIKRSAFLNCDSITEVTLPSSLDNLEPRVFSCCNNLTSIKVADGNVKLVSEDGVLYSSDKTSIIQYPAGKVDNEYIIEGTVKIIGKFAFEDCKNLTQIIIPDGAEKIDGAAFFGCSGIEEIEIPESVNVIEYDAFNECSKLNVVNIPAEITKIASQAFRCTAITDISIPQGVTIIENGAFNGCSDLKSITIPSSVTEIGKNAFILSPNITDVYYMDIESEWNNIVIDEGNENLTNATIHFMADAPVITETNQAIGKVVTLSAQEGATIYYYCIKDSGSDITFPDTLYSIDGANLIVDYAIYSEPIAITNEGSYKICAFASAEGNINSSVTEQTVTVGKSEIPSSSRESGEIVLGRTVELSTSDSNSVIYYTTDGSTPTTESDVYSEPIKIDEPKTIKAISTTPGCSVSDEAVYTYSIMGTAPMPVINISNIDGGKLVTLTNDIEDAEIYYTLDSTTPNESSIRYTSPIEIKTAGVKYIKAIAVVENCKNSPVTSDIVAVEKLEKPTVLTLPGRVQKGTAVQLSAPVPEADIYYTTDGTSPTILSEKYNGNIVLNNSQTIKAIAVMKGYVSSDVAEFSYTVFEKSATPVITIKSNKGIYSAEITCGENAEIYYTLDGSVPGKTSEKYTEPIILDKEGSYVIKAISATIGYEDSDAAETTITLNKTSKPSANTAEGKVEKGTVVELSGDGTIYYTLNGGNETVYSSPIVIEQNTTIKAYAVANGCLRSDVTELNYRTDKLTSGVDGGIVWNFNNEILTLTGSGAIPDYVDAEAAWKELADDVKHIVIEDGITAVGINAFSGMKETVSIDFPDTMLAIGNNAFDGCSSLIDIHFPETLQSLGSEAFKGCDKLDEIEVPESVSVVGKGAFCGCDCITSITIPFIGSQQGSVNSSDVFAYIFDGEVPESLKKVAVTSETFVPENAFKDCGNIEIININDTIAGIGASAFDGCTVLKEFTVPDGISEIADNTFRGCENAIVISVPDSVTAIGSGAFDGCKKLGSITIPYGVMEIKDYTFRDCNSLYSVEIPNSVNNIGIDVLQGCKMLHTLKVPFIGANTNPGVTEITNEGVLGYLFGQSESGTVQGEYTYAIPASLTKVEVTGTESSGYIPPGAFMNCANIVDILIDGGRNVCKNAFSNCRLLQNLYIPKSVANIDEGILEGCTNLETLTVPFIGTNKRDNKKETSVLGYFFGWSDTLLNNTDVRQEYAEGQSHFYHIPGTLKNVSVLSQTDIPYGAFMECYSLEQVSIVTGAVMNDMAFYNCTGLKKVTLPIDLLTIGYEAFAECESLESINLPNNTKTIGDNAFYNARKLKEITIPRSVEEIAEEVFNGTGIFSDGDVQLMAAGVTIICAAGSKAEEFAIEKGINYVLVDDSELNIKQTSTTVNLLSDNSYLFDVTDPYRQNGTLYIDVYDADSNLLSSKNKEADDVEYRVSFEYDEIPNVSYAMIYILDENGEMVTTTTEIISVDGGDIPEIPETNVNLKYENGAVTITGSSTLKRGTLLLEAIYDADGVLKSVNTYNVPGLNIPIEVDTNYTETDEVKFMLWESLEGIKPVSDFIVI